MAWLAQQHDVCFFKPGEPSLSPHVAMQNQILLSLVLKISDCLLRSLLPSLRTNVPLIEQGSMIGPQPLDATSALGVILQFLRGGDDEVNQWIFLPFAAFRLKGLKEIMHQVVRKGQLDPLAQGSEMREPQETHRLQLLSIYDPYQI